MPKLSKKGLQMPQSPIRKLVPFAEDAKQRGTEVIHLNIGQPDIQTPAPALEAIKNYNEKVVAYSHSAGNESYRKALANYYQNIGLDIDFTNILVTTGGSEAITMTLNSIMDPGDELIIPEPFYANYNGFSISSGVQVVPITASLETGFALPSISDFEAKITSSTKAIMICNPGNPTGYLYSLDELNQLAALAKTHDLFLIADEVYREFAYDGTQHHSILELGIEEHAIVIDSTSKRYSMCGARVGCLITKNEAVYSTCLKFAQARLSPPSFGQVAGEAALATGQDYFDEVIDDYLERRNVLVDGLNAIEGVRCPKPKGAFYCIAELPVEDAEHFAQWLLESFSHQGATLMVAPAQGFYSSPEIGKKQIRLAYVLNVNKLKLALEVLEAALKTYPNI
ncbi:MAG: pyridoxal phosphate-dependent aminotransferase [Flavobacteriales bacterium]